MSDLYEMGPEYFYKYKYIDETHLDYSCRIFTDNELYFSKVDDFNDPFDCRYCCKLDGSEADLAEYHDKIQRKHYPSRNEQERRLETSQWLKDIKAPGYKEKIQQDLRKTMVSMWAVYSLSAVPDGILMWAHYANGHRGFCLQFLNDTNNPFCAKRPPDDPDPEAESHPNLSPFPVTYSDNYPTANFNSDDETLVRKALLTKAAQWSYEKEWRMLDLNGPGPRKFPPQFLTGVIFGCEMSDVHKGMIREWCKGRWPPVRHYEARRAADTYALKIVPV